MPHPKPNGLAILLGAGPTTGAGIARILSSPAHGNLAVALLSRSGSPALLTSLRQSSPESTLHTFKADTSSPKSLSSAFDQIKSHPDLQDLPLTLAIWNVKHSHRTAFADETVERFADSLQTYVTGAMVFAQLVTRWMLEQDGVPLSGEDSGVSGSGGSGSGSGNGGNGGGGGGGDGEVLRKKGTLIFTGTLGALRTNANYAAYGAGRSGVRMLAQSLAREYSGRGIHVVHAIANGGITDAVDAPAGSAGDGAGAGAGDEDEKAKEEAKTKVAKGERMRAESVGKLYLQLSQQEVDLWVHELDMRPAAEKF